MNRKALVTIAAGAIARATVFTACSTPAQSTPTSTAVPNSRGVVLSIYAENVLASIGKVLGAQDVEVGAPRFDAFFVVKSNAEDVARAWLHGDVTEDLCQAPDFRFELENGTLRATFRGLVDDGPKLARALRAVAKLAARGRELEGEWAEAASRAGASSASRSTSCAPIWAASR